MADSVILVNNVYYKIMCMQVLVILIETYNMYGWVSLFRGTGPFYHAL